MRVTKFPQSCLRLEKDDGGRLLVDPGTPALSTHDVADIGPAEAVLYTHRHPDHLDLGGLERLLEQGAQAYGNADVVAAAGDLPVQRIDDGDAVTIAGYTVHARDLEHMPMVDGSAGPPNTGFMFDGTLFHPGDGLDLPGLRADVLALPIAGPSASMRDAYEFLARVGAREAIPIHYDVFPAHPEVFARWCDLAEVRVLADGETAELRR